MNGLHVQRVAKYKLDVFIQTQISQPVPGEHTLGANDQVLAISFDGAQEVAWIRADISMQPLVALSVKDADRRRNRIRVVGRRISSWSSLESCS